VRVYIGENESGDLCISQWAAEQAPESFICPPQSTLDELGYQEKPTDVPEHVVLAYIALQRLAAAVEATLSFYYSRRAQ